MKRPAEAHSVAQSLQTREWDKDDRIWVSHGCKSPTTIDYVLRGNVTYGRR